ncbi:MAG TPA: thioredoxin family protein [Planktothrix sp.]|jgi:thiol:disulfide interchange protein
MQKQIAAALLLAVSFFGATVTQTPARNSSDNNLIASNNAKPKKVKLKWYKDMNSALAEARNEGREFVFAHVGAKWCGPCRFMEKSIFPDPRVKQFLAEHYVNCVIDDDSAEGKAMTHNFGMRGIPALFVFDNNGNLRGKMSGSTANPDVFIQAVQLMTERQLNRS